MKNFLRMLAVLLLLALVFAMAGCGEDPIIPKKLWYTITPMSDTVVLGTSLQFKIVSNADSMTSDIPEAKMLQAPISKIVETGLITETTIYHVVFYLNGKGVDIANPTFFVRDPTMEELLCLYGPWSMVKLEFQDAPGLPWYEADIWDCNKDNLLYFYLTPTKKEVSDRGEILCSNEPKTSEGPWTLSGNILNTGGEEEIITLNQDTLIWVYRPGTLDSTRETFIHP
ncbi:MAG: hypothetical protein WC780_04215 [Lentimicrobiaceae bacterium]|jgi:hypothetical protein